MRRSRRRRQGSDSEREKSTLTSQMPAAFYSHDSLLLLTDFRVIRQSYGSDHRACLSYLNCSKRAARPHAPREGETRGRGGGGRDLFMSQLTGVGFGSGPGARGYPKRLSAFNKTNQGRLPQNVAH